MNQSSKKTVRVSGDGNTKDHAIASALSKIQKKVMSDNGNKGVILRIEPLDVTIVEAQEIASTERFLLFFFPRKRIRYEVTLDVQVDIMFMDTAEVDFEKVEVKKGAIRSILGNG